MKTMLDFATNAACPQRPSWQISPVGYEWARTVFADRQDRVTNRTPQLFRKIAELFSSRINFSSLGADACQSN